MQNRHLIGEAKHTHTHTRFPLSLRLFSFDEISIWSTDKCTPLVREITFENAEELTEEGLPFLILFHNPEDNESVKRFTDIVQQELMGDKRERERGRELVQVF